MFDVIPVKTNKPKNSGVIFNKPLSNHPGYFKSVNSVADGNHNGVIDSVIATYECLIDSVIAIYECINDSVIAIYEWHRNNLTQITEYPIGELANVFKKL